VLGRLPRRTVSQRPDAGHHPGVLTFEQRAWLRAFLDWHARERLVELAPGAHRCLGCGARMHERTPGCHHCRFRQAARRRRNRQLFAELRLPDEGRARGGYLRWANGNGAAE
jgi:hypothetical protein